MILKMFKGNSSTIFKASKCREVQGGFDGTLNGWDDYSRYGNHDGVDMPQEFMGICIMVMVMQHIVLIHLLICL
ncbi:hypothetical protein R6Q59_025189 [Mikania micrantha]